MNPEQKGNQFAVVHGGAAAEKSMARNEPFHGLALEEQRAVEADLISQGAVEQLKIGAIRWETLARLYWKYFLACDDPAEHGRLLHQFGRAQDAAIRAWKAYTEAAGRYERGISSAEMLARVKRMVENDPNEQ